MAGSGGSRRDHAGGEQGALHVQRGVAEVGERLRDVAALRTLQRLAAAGWLVSP
jgi:glutamate mutase epsilon subunit